MRGIIASVPGRVSSFFMPSHPIVVVIAVVAVLVVIGIVVSLVRGRSTFSGYEDIAEDCRQIAKTFSKSEIFRDGNDLVVSGNFGKLPTIVRFSYDENTPALNVHMKAPSTFNMSVVPKGSRATEGRVLVRTPDDMFDARFTTRSDNPTQAKMFTSGRTVMQALQKVCCSSKTFFTVTHGAIELSELTMPQPYMGRHVNDHIGMMGTLAKQLAEMPGSESVKIHAMQRERSSWPVKAAVAVGVLVAVITVVAATREYGKPTHEDIGQNIDVPSGMTASDAQLIVHLQGWRAAKEEDFAGVMRGWLRDNDQTPAGRLVGDFSGQGPSESAYLLINEETGKRRVVVVGHGAIRYDAIFEKVAGIGRVSKDSIDRAEWELKPQGKPDGEGLMVVFSGDKPEDALVVFLEGQKLLAGKPTDFQRLRLN